MEGSEMQDLLSIVPTKSALSQIKKYHYILIGLAGLLVLLKIITEVSTIFFRGFSGLDVFILFKALTSLFFPIMLLVLLVLNFRNAGIIAIVYSLIGLATFTLQTYLSYNPLYWQELDFFTICNLLGLISNLALLLFAVLFIRHKNRQLPSSFR